MKHSRDFPHTASSPWPDSRALSRRSFMRLLGAGLATAAVEGCGGGSGGGGAAPAPAAPTAPAEPAAPVAPPAPAAPGVTPTDPALTWLPIPALVFTQGVPSSISISNYVSALNVTAFNISLDSTPLPTGVTFNSATRAFDYDGRGNVATSNGHVLTAAAAA